jgi:hypothetical protein
MKFLTFVQAKIDGEDSPKVVTMGKVAIDVDCIAGFHTCQDKYDVGIKGVSMIRLRDGIAMLVKIEFDELLEKIQDAHIGS